MKEVIREYSDMVLAIAGSACILEIIRTILCSAKLADLVNLWLAKI